MSAWAEQLQYKIWTIMTGWISSLQLHCLAWQNITTQHYVINYIFYLQTIYSYPAHMIQNTFKIFGGNFYVYSKQHSDTLNCQLSLSKQQLNESSHYCLAHSNSSVKAQLLRCSHQIGSLNTLIGVSISSEELLTGRLQTYKIQIKMEPKSRIQSYNDRRWGTSYF